MPIPFLFQNIALIEIIIKQIILKKMTQNEIMDALHSVFRTVLKNDSITLTAETTANDVDGWDSVTNVMIIDEIEKQFGVSFKLRDIIKMKNVGDLCNKVLEKIG